MSKVNQLLELVDFSFPTKDAHAFPFDIAGAKSKLSQKLASCGMANIQVEDMTADEEGNIIVVFSDFQNSMEVVFSRNEEGSQAIIVGEKGDAEDEENVVIDLDPLGPALVKTEKGDYINMLELSWLNKPTLETIFTAGELTLPKHQHQHIQKDAVGNIIIVPAAVESYEYDIEKIEIDEELNEGKVDEVIYKVVVRNGKRERRPLVRRLRKKRLTPKQRAGLRKAARTRKTSASKMKRKRSLQLRKRMHMKPTKTRRGFRVG